MRKLTRFKTDVNIIGRIVGGAVKLPVARKCRVRPKRSAQLLQNHFFAHPVKTKRKIAQGFIVIIGFQGFHIPKQIKSQIRRISRAGFFIPVNNLQKQLRRRFQIPVRHVECRFDFAALGAISLLQRNQNIAGAGSPSILHHHIGKIDSVFIRCHCRRYRQRLVEGSVNTVKRCHLVQKIDNLARFENNVSGNRPVPKKNRTVKTDIRFQRRIIHHQIDRRRKIVGKLPQRNGKTLRLVPAHIAAFNAVRPVNIFSNYFRVQILKPGINTVAGINQMNFGFFKRRTVKADGRIPLFFKRTGRSLRLPVQTSVIGNINNNLRFNN